MSGNEELMQRLRKAYGEALIRKAEAERRHGIDSYEYYEAYWNAHALHWALFKARYYDDAQHS